MKKIFPALLLAAISLLTFSCVLEKDIDDNRPLPKDEAQVVLRLKTPSGFSSPASRSLTFAQENNIGDIYVLVFDKSGTLVAIKQGADVTSTPGHTNPSYSGEGSFAVTLEASKTTADTYNLVVLANAQTILGSTIGFDVSAIGSKDYASVMAAIWSQISGPMYSAGGTIPMWGESGQLVVEPGNNNRTLQLTRSVARIDVGVGKATKDGSTDAWSWDGKDASDAAIPFELANVYVIKPNNRYAVAPDASKASGVPTVPAGTTAFSLTDSESNFGFAATPTATGGYTSRDIYVPEADVKMGASGASGDANHTDRMAIVVGGYYNGSATETFYRLDFAVGGSLVNVQRNHLYQFNISKVSGDGYPDVETAYNSLSMNMAVDIYEWNETDMGDIWFDGQYVLSVRPGSELEFYKDPDNRTIEIKTDYPTGWQIQKITEADGTTVNSGWLTTDKTTGSYYGADGSYVPMDVSVSINDTGNPRTGYIYIKAGRIEGKITVTQSDEGRFGITLIDGDGNEIHDLFFAVNPTQAQRVYLSFAPNNAPLDVNISYMNGSYTPMDLSTYGDEPVSIPGGGSSGYEAYDLLPAPFPADETDPGQGGDPFLMKTARVLFEITHPADGRKAMASFYVYQRSPNLTVDRDIINAVFTGTAYNIGFMTNADWEVDFGGDSPHLATAVTPTSGGASAGQQVFTFSVPYDLAAAATSFTVVFKSPTGEFADKTVTVNVAKPTLTINPTSANFTYAAHGAAARNTTFTINTNIPADQLNITRSGAAVTNHSFNSSTMVVTVSVAAAISSQTTGTVTVKSGQMSATFNVTRGARPGTNFNGVYMDNWTRFQANWSEANTICLNAGGRLPTVPEYKQAQGNNIATHLAWFPGYHYTGGTGPGTDVWAGYAATSTIRTGTTTPGTWIAPSLLYYDREPPNVGAYSSAVGVQWRCIYP